MGKSVVPKWWRALESLRGLRWLRWLQQKNAIHLRDGILGLQAMPTIHPHYEDGGEPWPKYIDSIDDSNLVCQAEPRRRRRGVCTFSPITILTQISLLQYRSVTTSVNLSERRGQERTAEKKVCNPFLSRA